MTQRELIKRLVAENNRISKEYQDIGIINYKIVGSNKVAYIFTDAYGNINDNTIEVATFKEFIDIIIPKVDKD